MKTDHNRVSSVSSLYRKSLFCHIIGAACCLHLLSVLSKYYLPRSWHFFLFKKKMWNIFRISILPHNWSHLSLSLLEGRCVVATVCKSLSNRPILSFRHKTKSNTLNEYQARQILSKIQYREKWNIEVKLNTKLNTTIISSVPLKRLLHFFSSKVPHFTCPWYSQ